MSGVDAPAPWRIAFDNARDPYTARNALGAEKIGGGGGGGGGAPDSAEYIVAATDATLTAERVLTNTATITWDFTTPGQAKASTAAGGGNVSNSGTPVLGQYAKWVTATTIQGVSAATVLGDIGAQPIDADLTAIAALTGTNTIYYRSAANTWSPVVISTGLAFSGGNLTCTVSTAGSQPLDATLTALAAYNTNGLLTQTAADTFTGRTLTGPAAGITVSNGNGVAGNPTLALADDLAAIEALTGTNTIYYRSGASAWSAVTFSGLTFTGGVLTASASGGNVSNSGTPTVGQYGRWVTATTIEGVAPATVLSDIGAAPLASPTFTGDPKAPTPTAGDNDTSVATTAFVTAAVAAAGGGTATLGPPQGRLTCNSSGIPVLTSSVVGSSTMAYANYVGDKVPIYNGSTWTMNTINPGFDYISISTSDTTRNPAAIGASKCNDWFVWDSGLGYLYLSHGPDWTNDTTRSAGTALVKVNGIWLNAVAITNGPAASRGTYVGTTRSNASSQLDWIYGVKGAPPTAGFFGVWNAYNRVDVATQLGDTTSTWTYATAAWQAARNQATARVSYVVGLAEDAIDALYDIQTSHSAGSVAIGIGVDSTTTFSGHTALSNTTVLSGSAVATYRGIPGIGFHYVSAIEYTTGATATFYGSLGVTYFQSGLSFTLRM